VDVVFLIGRILFVIPFLMAVQLHVLNREQGVQYARMYKVPLAELGVPLTGLMAFGGGVSVLLGIWGDLGALLIAAFLFLITPFMHAFWREEDPMQKANQRAHFTKNLALAGGALFLFYLWNQLQGDAGLSITDPLFNRW
jgi:uncharacterized membrane protein YphA (DoxX/SURF4 family)